MDSLREILLLKTAKDEDLHLLVSTMADSFLKDAVIEALEKMASHKGSGANSAITTWGGYANNADANMLRDALGHHVSHYKAARAAGDDTNANKHLERFMHLMDFATKAQKHSNGKLQMDFVPPHAWEMNYTGNEQRVDNHGRTKYVQDQQGFKRRLGSKASAFPDYRYLEHAPHAGYKNKGNLKGHDEAAYPFHEVKVNGKHISIDDVPHTGQFEHHYFDANPVNNYHNEYEHSMSDDKRQKYAKEAQEWPSSDLFNGWLDEEEQKENANPAAYAQRGVEPSPPVHAEPVPNPHDPIRGRRK